MCTPRRETDASLRTNALVEVVLVRRRRADTNW
jgi:hypothetical protein